MASIVILISYMRKCCEVKEAELGQGHSLINRCYSPYENPTKAMLAEYLHLEPLCHFRLKLYPPVLYPRLDVLSN